jgi:hypothetical protein
LAAMAHPAGGLRRDLVLHLHGGAVDDIGGDVGEVGEAPVNVHATKIRQPVRGRARFDSKRLEGASLEGAEARGVRVG